MLQVITLSGRNPYLNLAYEQYLLKILNKSQKDIYLLFYENGPAVILGKTQKIEEEVYAKKTRHAPIIRRESGGGAVVHFKGNLNYAFLLSLEQYPAMFNISDSYCLLLNIVADSVKEKLQLSQSGISDLCVNTSENIKKKLSGNAQARKNKWLLHHGTFLYNTENLRLISYWLQQPQKQPDYRKNRNHRDFMIRRLPKLSIAEVRKKIVKNTADYFQMSYIWRKVDPYLEFNHNKLWPFFSEESAKMKLQ